MSPTKTKPKEHPATFEQIADEIRDQLAAAADVAAADPFGEPPQGVNHPAHVAKQALDLFDKHRYNRAFELIADKLVAWGSKTR